MKIDEVLLVEYNKKRQDKFLKPKDPNADLDWEDDEAPSDPEKDKIQHIVMQLRKAADYDGNYPITFQDGSKAKLGMNDIALFLRKYESVKPQDKEKMQQAASMSKADFDKVVRFFKGESRPSYMDHEGKKVNEGSKSHADAKTKKDILSKDKSRSNAKDKISKELPKGSKK